MHDICEATAYYAHVNRIADGLGVTVEDWYPPDPPMGTGRARRRVSRSKATIHEFFTDADIGAVLGWAELIQAIEQIMVEPEATAPARTFHTVPDGNGNDAAFLLKPGCCRRDHRRESGHRFPDNGEQGLPMVQAGVLLFDGVTGSLVGACEANTLTTRRTAAASAVAANVSRTGASRLLVVGTGIGAEGDPGARTRA